MKTKLIIFIAVAAVTTLSFTFVGNNERDNESDSAPIARDQDAQEPIGGFFAEDSF